MRWKFQLVGGSSCLVEDCERTDSFVIKLFLWSRKVKVGGVQPDLVADLVVTHVLLLLVVLSLHIVGGLFKGVAGFGVDLTHFLYEVSGGGIGEGIIILGVGEDSRILSVEYHEWTLACRAVDSVVVSELDHW